MILFGITIIYESSLIVHINIYIELASRAIRGLFNTDGWLTYFSHKAIWVHGFAKEKRFYFVLYSHIRFDQVESSLIRFRILQKYGSWSADQSEVYIRRIFFANFNH